MNEIKTKLESIVSYLNSHFNQDSDEYSICQGPKPQVIKYDEHTAISLWACGAIVCIGSLLYFIGEDDGNWFIREEGRDYAFQGCFSIGWADSFVNAMTALKKYTEENGTPVYYSGTDILCHYKL